jgi:hypothetical protein
MFNRTGYDRSLYDRSSNLDNLDAILRGSSKLTTNLVVQSFFAFESKGVGGTLGSLKMLHSTRIDFSGEGVFDANDFRLRLDTAVPFSGHGSMNGGVGARVPFDVEFDGSGSTKDSLTYLLQHVTGLVSGSGIVTGPLVLKVFLESFPGGYGDAIVNDKFKLELPLTVELNGYGDLTRCRPGELNSDVLEFDDLNLRPGQVLTIDSDELNVFIDNVLDVSGVTSDSVFFHLQPGENEITFATNATPNLEVTIIWQNRWL